MKRETHLSVCVRTNPRTAGLDGVFEVCAAGATLEKEDGILVQVNQGGWKLHG